MDATWYKLKDGTWGVKIRHDGQPGEEVTVTNKKGDSKQVFLNARVAKFDDAELWSVTPIDGGSNSSQQPVKLRKVVKEVGRTLGWSGDRQLLVEMSHQGFDPIDFRVTSEGLAITFEQTKAQGPSDWEYDCNQEGGDIEMLIAAVSQYSAHYESRFSGLFEPIFAYRTGSEGADSKGMYIRFIGRAPRDHETKSPRSWQLRAVALDSHLRQKSPGTEWQQFCQITDTYRKPHVIYTLYRSPVWGGPG